MGQIIAIFIGVIAGNIFAIAMWPNKLETAAREAIAQCEKSLPRDQHCELIATPVKKEEK